MAGGKPKLDYAAKRAARQKRFDTRLEWFADRLTKGIKVEMSARLQFAAQILRDQVVINLSVPVVKVKSGKGKSKKTVVVRGSRSKPGEFPRADTTRLMKDIFYKEIEPGRTWAIGTTLDYGLRLETRMQRSFLVRTLNEMRPKLIKLLVAPGEGQIFRQHREIP